MIGGGLVVESLTFFIEEGGVTQDLLDSGLPQNLHLS